MIVYGNKQKEIITAPFEHTLEVNEGTPRSGKTTGGHGRYANYILRTRDENHLVVGYNQEQAYRLFMDGDGTGLIHIFKGFITPKHDKKLGDYMELITPKGIRKIFWKGAGKANSVGGITGMSLGSVVFCEINLLNLQMIQECFRRTFAAKDRFHLADLNPPAPHHPVIKEVFEVQDTKWTHWTPEDNPILDDKRKKELFEVLSKNPYLLQRDWYGKRVMPTGVIYSVWSDKNVWHTLQGKNIEMFFSGDGGQSDATSVGCYIVVQHEGKYKVVNVASYSHSGSETGEVKAMSTYAREIDEFIKWCRDRFQMRESEIFIDPACKSLREELHLLGHHTKGADNNSKDVKGSSKGIEVGIERMQSLIENEQYLIAEIDDRYDHYAFLVEIGMYVRDDRGKPIDKYNHELDRARYATNYFYKRYIR